MRTFHLLCNHANAIEPFVLENELNTQQACFVRIHYSGKSGEEAVVLAQTVKGLFPNATIAGASVSGVIYNGEIYEEQSLLSFVFFENAKIINRMVPENGMSAEQLVASISEIEEGFEPAIAFLFYGRLHFGVGELAAGLSEACPGVPFVGGVAGYFDENGSITSFIFNETGHLDEGYSITYISKEYMLAYVNPVVGHTPISKTYTITKASGEYIDEIDGMPAVDWIYNHLGIRNIQENSDWANTIATDILLRFPFVLSGQDGASRFIQYEEESNRIKLYFCSLSEGQTFSVGYLSPLQSAAEWQEVCCDLQTTPVETLFCYSCLFRKVYLKNLAKWEMRPFRNNEICGAFLMGEIGSKNRQTHHYNGSCIFFTMAEKEQYIDMDLHAFDSINELQDENVQLIEQMSRAQEKLGLHRDETLLGSLLKSEERLKDRVLFKNQLGLTSMTEYIQEQSIYRYKKICLVKFNEYEKHIDRIGFDAYQQETSNFLSDLQNYLANDFARFQFKFYNFNIGSFFFVAENDINDAEFIQVTQALHSRFSELHSTKNEMHCVNCFVVTLLGGNIQDLWDMLEGKDGVDAASSFIVFDPVQEETDNLLSEFKTVAAIQYALDEDKVIPYFQGVYDNQNTGFAFYEALMRLQSEDRKILLPGNFLQTAKKYNLYEQLSLRMVMKVFDLFCEREETVSINISALDILSENFQTTVFDKLSCMPSTNHFIFELVETEQFENTEILRNFIWRAKQHGIRIAVDDFGSGYSNFVELGNLDIDYIKLSGTLIQLLGTDTSYDQIFQSVLYLSKKMQVDLVAECVETASMQKRLVENNVRFSQGYLFSTPMSFDELRVTAADKTVGVQNNFEKGKTENKTIANAASIKKTGKILLYGGLFVVVAALLVTIFFDRNTSERVERISDTFLMELATSMADKISIVVENSSSMLLTVKSAILLDAGDEQDMMDNLAGVQENTGFDNLYLAFGTDAPMNSDGQTLALGDQDFSVNGVEDEITVLSPVVDEDTGRELLLLGTPIYSGDEWVGTLYGSYYLDTFSDVLDLKSFGGDAFFHLCEIDGTPLILSGNSNNLFTGGDMYTFIGSLDMQNGHTAQSLHENMINREASLLKYLANGEERSAVMVTVPGTSWCVVSIVQNDVSEQIVSEIQTITLGFSIFVITIFAAYFTLTLIVIVRGRKELEKALESSYFLANSLQTSMETDPLTRTYSRATATEKVTEAIARANDGNAIHALVIMDVDNFKKINDVYGHQTGDVYLKEFVNAIKSGMRGGDIIGRLGGDEFIIMLSDIPSLEVAKKVMDRIFKNVSQISIQDISLDGVGVSAGLVMIPEHGNHYDELNNKADQALYAAKKSGKNKYVVYGE